MYGSPTDSLESDNTCLPGRNEPLFPTPDSVRTLQFSLKISLG